MYVSKCVSVVPVAVPDVCKDEPACENGGTCVAGDNGPECKCRPGYNGDKCENG